MELYLYSLKCIHDVQYAETTLAFFFTSVLNSSNIGVRKIKLVQLVSKFRSGVNIVCVLILSVASHKSKPLVHTSGLCGDGNRC